MISVTPWLFYFCVLRVQNVIAVRIFDVLPMPSPKIHVQFVPEVLKKSCLLKPQRGPCRANIEMYYFDPQLSNCSIFEWGGCQGNGNRYDDFEACLDYCLSKPDGPKSRPHWCALSFDYGYCFGSVKRYYFDNLWKVCKSTIYSGCGGNRNNFYTKDQCESVCLYGNGPLIRETNKDEYLATAKKHLIINPTTVSAATYPPSNTSNAQ